MPTVLMVYKFVQDVAKPNNRRYPPETVYQILAALRRYIAEKKLAQNTSPLDSPDKT